MVKHTARYQALGAELPHGLLLYGVPGIGKSLLAQCLIEACGLPSFVLRKTEAEAEQIKAINKSYQSAIDKAPAIVLLDDLDKFGDNDVFAAVQAAIDGANQHKVFTVATANKIHQLPSSLRRAGRFDRIIEVSCPSLSDAKEIIRYYLKDKKVASDVNPDDLAK